MKITITAKNKLVEYLSKDSLKIPAIVWSCSDVYKDPIEEGFWQFGFYDIEQLNSLNEHFRVNIDGINFMIDIPEVLRNEFNHSSLDYIDSCFVIIKQ